MFLAPEGRQSLARDEIPGTIAGGVHNIFAPEGR
jgi:hypothetical protein